MLIDLHAHSAGISTCCKASLENVICFAKAQGIDGVVLTNHYQKNYLREGESPADFAERYLAEYTAARTLGASCNFPVFFGIEVTMSLYYQVHMLVYGVDESFVTRHPTMYDYTQAELYAAVKAAGGTMVQAHPMRLERNVLLDVALLDGVEANCHPKYYTTHLAEMTKIAHQNGILLTCGGDFHKDTHRPRCGVYLPDHLQNTREIMAHLQSSPSITLCVQEPTETESHDVVFRKTKK